MRRKKISAQNMEKKRGEKGEGASGKDKGRAEEEEEKRIWEGDDGERKMATLKKKAKQENPP